MSCFILITQNLIFLLFYLPPSCFLFNKHLPTHYGPELVLFAPFVVFEFSLLWETLWPKSTQREESLFFFYFFYTSTFQSLIEGSQVRNSVKKPAGRNRPRGYGGKLLTDLFPVVCSAGFLITPGTTNWGNVPQVCPLDNLVEAFFSMEGSASKMTLAFVKFTYN